MNSVMSFALLPFLSGHPNIQEIVQKFGTPGHSPVQEVDNIHSQIERRMRKTEIQSVSDVATVETGKHAETICSYPNVPRDVL